MFFDDKGKKYAEGVSVGQAFLAANKSQEVNFDVKIHLDSMSSEFINDFISKDSVKISCKVSGILGLLKIKITEKLEFALESKQLLEPLKKEFLNNKINKKEAYKAFLSLYKHHPAKNDKILYNLLYS
jgi:hypothetical protein